MSKVTNKQIAKRLKLAVEQLAHNQHEIVHTYKQMYICLAVERTSSVLWYRTAAVREQDEIRAIKDMIGVRIWPREHLGEWLRKDAGIPIEQLTTDNLQTYRHAWLQELIKEFSK